MSKKREASRGLALIKRCQLRVVQELSNKGDRCLAFADNNEDVVVGDGVQQAHTVPLCLHETANCGK